MRERNPSANGSVDHADVSVPTSRQPSFERWAVELSYDLIEVGFEEVLVGGLDGEGASAMRYTMKERVVV